MEVFTSNNNVSTYLAKILSCSDNDLCWCDSGLLFINCHKFLHTLKQTSIGKIGYLFYQLRKKKMCLHPEKASCSKDIIDAHSIQNSKSLDSISENGLVYRFEINLKKIFNKGKNELFMPDKIGKSNTSVFRGFCGYHDNKLFKEIDNNNIDPTQEQSVLLSIRSIAWEIYAKKTTSDFADIKKELGMGANSLKQAEIQVTLNYLKDGATIGLNDLWYHYLNFFRIYYTNDYSRLNRLVIKINENPEVLCSTSFFPEYDMEGNFLQDINTDDILELITFEVLSNGKHGIIQFCWYDNFISCKKFADSLCNSCNLQNAILKMLFYLSENHAFNITWFNNLSVIKKKSIMELAMSIENNNNIYILTLDKKKYINWTIKEIIKEY